MPKHHTMKMYMGHGGKAPPHITNQTPNAGGGGGGHMFHSLEIALSYPTPHSLFRHSTEEKFQVPSGIETTNFSLSLYCLRNASFYVVKVHEPHTGFTVQSISKIVTVVNKMLGI